MKSDVFGHSERLDLPVLPPVNETNHITGNIRSKPAPVVAVGRQPPPLLTCLSCLVWESVSLPVRTVLPLMGV